MMEHPGIRKGVFQCDTCYYSHGSRLTHRELKLITMEIDGLEALLVCENCNRFYKADLEDMIIHQIQRLHSEEALMSFFQKGI